MVELTPEELEARRAKVKADAQKAIARREKLNIRFSEEEIFRIQKMAEQRGQRVMPMLYEWVIDALVREEGGNTSTTYQTGTNTMRGSERPDDGYGKSSERKLAKVDGALRQLAQVLEKCGYMSGRDLSG